MSEFNENNQNQYNSQPVNPQSFPQDGRQPGQTYSVPQPPFNTGSPQGGQAPPQNTQSTAPPQSAQGPVPPQQPQSAPPYNGCGAPYCNAPPPQTQTPSPDYYRMTYGVPKPPKPPKESMSPGLKAFVAIVIALLAVCLVMFVFYITVNPGNNSDAPLSRDFSSTMPTYEYTYPQQQEETVPDNNYTRSDAQKETDPDFEGVTINKKPKDASGSYGASYSFEKLQSSVVGIVCYGEEDADTENYQSQGTGIVVTSDGYIVTNSHVIGNSRTAYLIKVITADKKEYDAGVVGYDTRTDIAVLKIKAAGLAAATFGDSTEIEITEDVIAIGNPRGINYQNSVTRGIISAVDRQVSSNNNVKFIQTDAAINPGNSGGPLCNMYGQVIGITSAKIASEDYEGMGFAIPGKTMKSVVDDIIKYSYVTNRVKIGITGTVVYADEKGAGGIQIAEISPGGPMDGTGAEPGDIITAVDGQAVSNFAEVYTILENHKAGEKIKITLYRPNDKKTYDVTVKLQADKN